MNCKETIDASLAAVTNKNSLAKLVDAAKPNCCCEHEAVSDFSKLGPVQDKEYLARLVLYPQHVENGELIPAAFHDVATYGLSVQRSDSSDYQQEWERIGSGLAEAQKIAKGKEITYLGAVVAECAEVRKIFHADPPIRSFAVYDTANKDEALHCDVMQVFEKTSRAQLSELRHELSKAFSFKSYLKEIA